MHQENEPRIKTKGKTVITIKQHKIITLVGAVLVVYQATQVVARSSIFFV